MKRKFGKILLLIFIFLFGAQIYIFPQGNSLTVGTNVAALFDDGNWYRGTIDAINQNKYTIITPEGRQDDLNKSRLKVLTSTLVIKKGERVAAIYGGSEMFSGGTVIKVEKGGAIIKWLDDTTPSFVENSKIITGIGKYDYKWKKEEDAASLVTFNIQNTEYQISKNTGRVYIKKGWEGTFDLASGSLTAHSSYNSSGKIESNGNFHLYKKGTSKSGYLAKNGEVYVSGKRIFTIEKSASGGKTFSWNDMCLMALVGAVYLNY